MVIKATRVPTEGFFVLCVYVYTSRSKSVFKQFIRIHAFIGCKLARSFYVRFADCAQFCHNSCEVIGSSSRKMTLTGHGTVLLELLWL
jgi:hypothetical protein